MNSLRYLSLLCSSVLAVYAGFPVDAGDGVETTDECLVDSVYIWRDIEPRWGFNCGLPHVIDCGSQKCNLIEFNAQESIASQQSVNPVGNGSCKINIWPKGRGLDCFFGRDENHGEIEYDGDVTCDSVTYGASVSKDDFGISASVNCDKDSKKFELVEGNFIAWCGRHTPSSFIKGGVCSSLNLESIVWCKGWSENGEVDLYADDPGCQDKVKQT